MQDNIGGLEVEDPHRPGTFVVKKKLFFHQQNLTIVQKPVPPIPGSIVVNAGDFLMMCSSFIGSS